MFSGSTLAAAGVQIPPPGPGMVPDYFGVVPNYATSARPIFAAVFPTNILDPSLKGSGASIAVSTFDYTTNQYTDHITNVQVVNGGQGYDQATSITVFGGSNVVNGGRSAVLVPTIVGGVITSITIQDAGKGYDAPIMFTDAQGNITSSTGIRKFVDSLSTLNTSNNLGQQLPVAIPDTTTFPGSDYYEIAETEYAQKLHSDLPATHLRGYKQLNAPAGSQALNNQYLGPVIVAQKDRPVRIKLVNQLSTGAAGHLPLPVDTTYMGSNTADATQNRTALHLHGGNTPWISDGTPRQTVKPKTELGQNKGESVRYVPDMWFDTSGNLIAGCAGKLICADAGASNNPGDGALTFYYTNQQSARLMFYHDHAEGLTRLNVYAGLAAGYVLRDPAEQAMITSGVLPADEIPLIIQEKTFVPDNIVPVLNFYGPFASQLNSQDPTWNWGSGVAANLFNGPGDLWVPHVFMPNQNPGDTSGANAMGRWDYGPWFWPPFAGIQYGPVDNPYFDPNCTSATATYPCEPQYMPGVPNGSTAQVTKDKAPLNYSLSSPSGTPEAFNDTPLVNGTVYPYINVEPKKYRLRMLSVGNDRMLNLSLVVAASKNSVTTAEANRGINSVAVLCDGTTQANPADCTEVKMVPFDASQNNAKAFPSWWYTAQKGGITFDGRPSGVFDPDTRGPEMVQIGTEGGFLSKPVAIKNQPVNFEYNPKNIVVGNIKEHALLLGPAERADVVVDFSQFAGSTLILYNDSPAPVPAFDLRIDYYTGNPDNTDTGGTFSTIPGYGPNTRTIMQIRVAANCSSANCGVGNNRTPSAKHPIDDVDTKHLAQLTTVVQDAFKTSQEPIIVPQAAYDSTVVDKLGSNLSRISDNQLTFTPTAQLTPVTLNLEPKSIIEDWTMDYGRMNALLGVEVPRTTATIQTSIPQAYIDPPTELVKITPNDNATPISGQLSDGTQLWKITHNGVDSHAVHFHLFHVQVVNRVGWDGAIYPPEENELGWKDTVLMHPLMDIIVALRPKSITLPFKVQNSQRILDPSHVADNTPNMFFNLNPINGNASNVTNTLFKTNFGWEYVWHCHILGHEENDMMRSIAVAQAPETPSDVTVTENGTKNIQVNWIDNSVIANWFTVERDVVATFDSKDALHTIMNVKVDECTDQAGCPRSFVDTTAPLKTALYYRVMANNTVGAGDVNGVLPKDIGSKLVPGFTGYGNVTASSPNWSSGQTVNAPNATVSPLSLAFSPPSQLVGTSSASQSVTISNTGNAPLTLSAFSTSSNVYTIPNGSAGGTCSTASPIAAGGSCTINVSFTPNTTGDAPATLTITDNSNNVVGSTQTVDLNGTGIAPIASLSADLVFGNQILNSSSTPQTVTLSNTGNADLTLSGIAVTGPFAIVNGGTCTATSVIAANKSCTLSVTFTPTTTGSATGTLVVTDNSNGVNGSTQAINLSGTGITSPTVQPPLASLSATTITFGNQIINTSSTAQTVTLTNTGGGSLSISRVALSSNRHFSIVDNCSAKTLAAGANCNVNITFLPTSTGNKTATLTFTDNANNVTGSQQSVSLTGTGVTANGAITLAPTTLDFGTVKATTTKTLSSALSNTVTADFNITSMSISGNYASLYSYKTTCGTKLAAASNCNIDITFAPTRANTNRRTATFTLNGSLAGSNVSKTISLTGVGN